MLSHENYEVLLFLCHVSQHEYLSHKHTLEEAEGLNGARMYINCLEH